MSWGPCERLACCSSYGVSSIVLPHSNHARFLHSRQKLFKSMFDHVHRNAKSGRVEANLYHTRRPSHILQFMRREEFYITKKSIPVKSKIQPTKGESEQISNSHHRKVARKNHNPSPRQPNSRYPQTPYTLPRSKTKNKKKDFSSIRKKKKNENPIQ